MGSDRSRIVLRELVQCEGPSVRSTQRNRDSRKVLGSSGRPALPRGLRVDPHRFPQPFDFRCFDLNASLSLGSALKIADCERLTAQHELPGVGASQPVVQTGDCNSQSLRSFLS